MNDLEKEQIRYRIELMELYISLVVLFGGAMVSLLFYQQPNQLSQEVRLVLGTVCALLFLSLLGFGIFYLKKLQQLLKV